LVFSMILSIIEVARTAVSNNTIARTGIPNTIALF
ncbi:MAG: hypothetical protein ACI9IJ_001067, partial [Psychromonas sp.]